MNKLYVVITLAVLVAINLGNFSGCSSEQKRDLPQAYGQKSKPLTEEQVRKLIRQEIAALRKDFEKARTTAVNRLYVASCTQLVRAHKFKRGVSRQMEVVSIDSCVQDLYMKRGEDWLKFILLEFNPTSTYH